MQTALADTKITAEFKSADGKLGGSSGCNRYFGGYETSKNKLTVIPPIGATMMACPGPIMEQEQEYLSLLQTAETFRIQGGKLTISTSGGQILVFAAQ
ncbi:META domain-containing protein [Chloroflexota bacterium]